ncbi:DUF2500 domain-containing protein [Neobacillus drentensis]|uniref:DUF2500 domain-containing protein n=1 Tax=Neobacillus drentensis TaxID=220684 RepID=UPI001F48411A|nr:DUF2500 domain-containing protein [Neobacillus drentensis]ULT54618.1 DUF2500 domain-containing protein [Neobacillus drentensis]
MEVNVGIDFFTIMEFVVPIFFIAIVGIILFIIIMGVKQWSHNNKQPRLHVNAALISKRSEVSGGGADHSSSTWYYATFQFESGDRMEFTVSGRDYGLLAEGDVGELVFQGTRYHGFTRKQNDHEPAATNRSLS